MLPPQTPIRPAASRSAASWPPDDQREGLVSARAIVLIVGTGVLLFVAKTIILPLTLAMLFTFILAPLVNFLRARGINDTVAVFATVTASAAIGAIFLVILAFQLGQIGSNFPQYQNNILLKIDTLLQAGNDSGVVTHLRFLFENISNRLGAVSMAPAEMVAPKVELVEQVGLGDWLTDVVLPVLRPLGVFGLIFVLVTFALLEREALRDRAVQLIGGSNVLATSRLLAEAGAGVSNYLMAQVLVNVIYAVPIWIGLWLIGVPNPLFFGIVTLVARFMPYIGALIAAVLPILMAFSVSPDWTLVLWTSGLFLIVELVTSNAIEPWFYGHRTGLSPLAVIVSAMFWTFIWGPLGLFLATPLTVCLVVIGHHVPNLRLFSIILGDKSALQGSPRLYDRLLTGRAYAETELTAATLDTQNLARYFNENLIPALKLAKSDYEAGLLSDSQIARVARGAVSLIHDLETLSEESQADLGSDHSEDPKGPAARPKPTDVSTALKGLVGPVVVLCGRSPLDEVAGLVLGHQLSVAGIETTVLDSAQEISGELNDLPHGTIVVASLDARASQQHDRQLRDLRRMYPATRVVVAVWPEAENSTPASQDYLTIEQPDVPGGNARIRKGQS